MLPEQLTIQDDFPPIGYDQWREVVEQDLKGAPFEKKLVTHTYEGIDLQPIYTMADAPAQGDPNGVPGQVPYVRGASVEGPRETGWDLRQEHSHPDLNEANKQILADLEGGVTSLQLRFDTAARAGRSPVAGDAADGLLVFSTADFEALLGGVHLDMAGLALDAGAGYMPVAAQLFALYRKRGKLPEEISGALNADPIGVLAAEGQLPYSLEEGYSQLVKLCQYVQAQAPGVTAIGVCSSPYHKAGATAAQDIGFSVATAVEYLRAGTSRGMSVDEVANQILFRMDVGTHHFLALAKLRAARRVWSRVVLASGGSAEAAAMQIHARTSDRVLTHRDAHVNLLRNTVAAFAASLGGAQVITSAPFDRLVGLPTEQSRRIARNTMLILQEEAHLNRVLDPAGGSWFLDKLTSQLAETAWSVLQQIEQQGGQVAALRSGWVAQQIDAAYAPRAKDIALRKEGITGVSEFPDVAEQPVSTEIPDVQALSAAASERTAAAPKVVPESTDVEALIVAAEQGATTSDLAAALSFGQSTDQVTPLEARSFAEPFEQLRDASDAWLAQHGVRPRIFLANLGPVAHHTARATYAKNFFEAGGYEVIGNDGFENAEDAVAAFQQSGASTAVLCSSDKLYPEFVPQVAPRLREAGARSVVLAGFPGDNEGAWRVAGVDRFIYIKCNVLTTLREMLSEEGVLAS